MWKKFKKHLNQTISSPNHFCSRSCAATYNNQHKTHVFAGLNLKFI